MNWNKFWDYLIYLIWAFMLFTTIYDLFNVPVRSIFWSIEFLISIFMYFKLKVPRIIYLVIMIVFLMNIFGELYFGFFYTIPNFDKWIHFLSPLAACTLFYFLFEKKIKNKKMLILFSIMALLTFEYLWEIIEYFFDQNFHTVLAGVQTIGTDKYHSVIQYMSRYDDTMHDMFYNLIGSIIFAVGALFFTRKKKNKLNKK